MGLEEERQAGRIPDDYDEDDEDESRDLRKRVKLDDLVTMYTALIDTNTWWTMYAPRLMLSKVYRGPGIFD